MLVANLTFAGFLILALAVILGTSHWLWKLVERIPSTKNDETQPNAIPASFYVHFIR